MRNNPNKQNIKAPKILVCFLGLHQDRKWSKSVLGKEFKFKFNDREYTIHTPKLHDHYTTSKVLEPPDIITFLRLEGKRINYGFTWASPSGDSTINTVVITTTISSIGEAEKLVAKIDEKISDLTERFFNYISVLRETSQIRPRIIPKDHTEYLYLNGLKLKRLNVYSEQEIAVFPESNDILPTRKNVEVALELLSKHKSIPPEFGYYISAKHALEIHDFRKCALDAATAVDMRLSSILKRKKIDVLSKISLDNCGIEKKYGLLKEYKEDVSDITIKRITKARNPAIHIGEEVGWIDAENSLADARRILLKYSRFW